MAGCSSGMLLAGNALGKGKCLTRRMLTRHVKARPVRKKGYEKRDQHSGLGAGAKPNHEQGHQRTRSVRLGNVFKQHALHSRFISNSSQE